MLYFPLDFFENEIREDFMVDSTMKTFWAASLEVLREISEVCERHDIQWYAAYGTLLGAIRHQGYVPWDDDMDIWMKRTDYDRFMEFAPKELPEGYLVQSPLTETGYTQFHSCIFNRDSVSVQEERLMKFHGCPFAVGVDIFPLDYLPDNPDEREGEKAIFQILGVTVEAIKKEDRTEEDRESIREAIETIEEVCQVHLPIELLDTDNERDLLVGICRLENQLCACYGEEDGSELVMYMDYMNWPSKVYRKEWFDDVKMQPFENVKIPVPKGYDEILKKIYGDYQKRVRASGMHDYPIYKKQLEHVREVTENLEEKVAKINQLIDEINKKQEKREE